MTNQCLSCSKQENEKNEIRLMTVKFHFSLHFFDSLFEIDCLLRQNNTKIVREISRWIEERQISTGKDI